MATTYSVDMFFIGNFADMDTNEGDFDTEAPGNVLGTHSTLSLVAIDEVDQDDDGLIYDDETPTSDFLSYDAGAGTVNVALDSSSIYAATVLLGDGSSITTNVLVLQTANGDVFVSDYPGGTSLDSIAVQSITLNSLVDSDAAGINAGFADVQNSSVVCFCSGTRILTPTGERRVEDLQTGDMVMTLDHGPQQIVWTNATTCFSPGRNAPVILPEGCLGGRKPVHPLMVSPQHRVLLRSRIAHRMFGASEVLVPAKYLADAQCAIQSSGVLPAMYYHFACSHHEIVFANGTEVETFFPGDQALRTLSQTARDHVLASMSSKTAARMLVSGHKARRMLQRHVKNKRVLSEMAA